MELNQIELVVINSIRVNLEDSGDEVPEINRDTELFNGGFGVDSLRAIEVLVGLEDVFEHELPPDKVFVKDPSGTDTIGDIAVAIKEIVEGE